MFYPVGYELRLKRSIIFLSIMKELLKKQEISPEPKTELNLLDVLDAFPFYVLLVDENHYIIEANNAVYQHLGVHRKEILGKYCPMVVHGHNQPFPGCPLEEAAEKEQAVERELFDKDTGKWISSAIYPTRARTPDGKKVFLHVVYDVTERRQAQEQIKISHERLRNLSAHLESVREEEKRKIARDLHDETAQLLASLHAHIEAAVETLPGDSDKATVLLRKAQELSTTVLDEIHNLIYELRPIILDEIGITAAVGSLIETQLSSTGIKFNIKTVGEIRRFPSRIETMLFRIVQESFTNIIKHAQATKVNVVLRFKKSGITIVVKDNGLGFDAEKTMSSKGRLGMGLLGMKERAELVRGTLTIKSGPKRGTEITVDVPSGGAKDGQD